MNMLSNIETLIHVQESAGITMNQAYVTFLSDILKIVC